MVKKHLYEFVNKTGRTWEHSDFCWCEQNTESFMAKALGTGTFELKFPHEVDDPYCRCEEPVARVEFHNDLISQTCVICGKKLH